MKLRPPSYPLIAVDPYFSVWSSGNAGNRMPFHWTESVNTLYITVTVDGEEKAVVGRVSDHKKQLPKLPQTGLDMDLFSTFLTFEDEKIRLRLHFSTPTLVTDPELSSRPVSALAATYESLDQAEHEVFLKISCGEDLVLNKRGEGRAYSEPVKIDGMSAVRMGSGSQAVLGRKGDNVRIDWGYFYLCVSGLAETGNEIADGVYAVYARTPLAEKTGCRIFFAYDDIDSINYFGKPLKAYWKKDGKTVEEGIAQAAENYEADRKDCREFGDRVLEEARRKGGDEYAELLILAYRQVMAAHKLVSDEEDGLLYISKECLSNGSAATVDVTYPSAPLFLLYNPELLKGMLRPIFRYAASDAWKYDFAPHDVGTYPLLFGQTYYGGAREYQMPVEECGNMIILMAALCRAEGNADFAAKHREVLKTWYRYLCEYGEDPENQLCTDDFAGHMAHNVNLAIKAVMGMAGYADILRRLNQEQEAQEVMQTARKTAESILARAQNPDGSTRLAFDQPDTYSLKYNAVWDKIFGTGLFPDSFFENETTRYLKEQDVYGTPLDNRGAYTKSDWLLWAACLSNNEKDFRAMIHPMWKAYHTMRSMAPMTDLYFTDTSEKWQFQHRSVQGGLFIRLMLP